MPRKVGAPTTAPVPPQMTAPMPPPMAPPGYPQQPPQQLQEQYAFPVQQQPQAPPQQQWQPPQQQAPPQWQPPAAPAPQNGVPTGLQAGLQGQMGQMMGRGGLSQINLAGASFSNFQLLPADRPVEFEIVKVTEEDSKAGNPMLTLQLRSTFPLAVAGVTVFDRVVLGSPDPDFTPWKFKSLASACVDDNGQSYLAPDGSHCLTDNAQDFVGWIVRANVKHGKRPSDGSPTNEIAGAYAVPTETPGCQPVGPTAAPPMQQFAPPQQQYQQAPPQFTQPPQMQQGPPQGQPNWQ